MGSWQMPLVVLTAATMGTAFAAVSCGGTAGKGGSSGTTSHTTGGSGGGSKASMSSSGTLMSSGTSTSSSSATVKPIAVQFTVDTTATTQAISPYIYGTNQGDLGTEAKNLTMTRVGGNRMTAYNWENNYSNAGSDYLYENDQYISKSAVAGDPMKQAVQAASTAGASIIMTVPMAGWVSATGNPAVQCPKTPTAAQIAQNFFPILPKKGSAFAYPPDLTDGKVYADEFVSWLESQFPNAQADAARRIFYMLDNEPDIWSGTHSEIHPTAVTYAELIQRTTDFATAIKGVAPKALVFGPVSYGWAGYVSLQSATDSNSRDFLDFYLDSMKAAETTGGKRIVDVLDVHWYPEATGDGKRIVDDGVSAGEVAARLQAPRSLWDSTYTETSWIAQYSTNGPINLIPRLMQKISGHYPGTKLSISEYNYGAGADISGGLAEADALGVFGSHGLFAAAMWEPSATNAFIFGGFALYRNYDGQGGTFGDTSVPLTNSDIVSTSAYASVFASGSSNVIVVAINKATTPANATITLKHAASLTVADTYVLTSASASPTKGAAVTGAAGTFTYLMPAYSATTLVFHP